MDHETHLSTEQTPPQKNRRIPRPHEDKIGSQGDQPPPPSWPEKTGRLTFSKGARLLKKKEFLLVAKRGQRLIGRYLCIDCHPSQFPRLGISASTRYGSSPERNRFKRLVREAFRKAYPKLPSLDLNIIPRKIAKRATLDQIQEELYQLLRSL